MADLNQAFASKNSRELESLCRKALFDFKMLEKTDKKIAVALSGGKDSLSLLFLLKKILGFGTPKSKLSAIHVEGDFSCGAMVGSQLLKQICKELKIPLTILKTPKPKTTEPPDCYLCSRQRRKLIFENMNQAGVGLIAFGHHRDDLAQTLLLNLLQKGEFAGMLPKIKMLRFGITIIRPLIYISEQKIKTFAEERGFFRATCQCPKGSQSKRKEVAGLIEILENSFPHARSNLALGALLYGSDKAKKI
ncbi:MAG: ATP-binding protein [Parachlamydiales bacterium]|jgi:tRNA(Ile)-lysidine synthase TilS/MesJ